MAQKLPNILLGELVKRNIISSEDLQSLQEHAQSENKNIEQVLVDDAIISDQDLLTLKADLYHVPVFDGDTASVDIEALREIPEEVASFYRVVPFTKEGNVIKIGVLDFENIDALEALKFVALDKGLALEKYAISHKDFDRIAQGYRSLSGDVGKALESIPEESGSKVSDTEKEVNEGTKLEDITAESPVIKIVGSILRHAVESRASDIHIEPFEDRVRVRFRIDGVLIRTLQLPKTLHRAIVSRVKILSDLKIDETRLAQDGRFSLKVGSSKIDYRVSTFPTRQGEKVVMRVLDTMANQVELDKLGIRGRAKELLEKAITRPFGCVLITGPTGSGKSTTIVGMIRRVNTEGVNIVTLEDPVEYYIDGVNQSQVHEEIGYTFAAGLRHILRQDPDIIVVGEIRDQETARLAVQAALTGHLVFSTLHTNDAIGIVPRLVDMGVEKYLIPPSLSLAVAQRLLRRLCPTCKVQSKANAAEEKLISETLAQMPQTYREQYPAEKGYTIYRPNTETDEATRCKECGGKAYKGRIGIYEMLEMTDGLEKIILGSISESALREEAKRQGMISMFQDGLIKMLEGDIPLEELMEFAQA